MGEQDLKAGRLDQAGRAVLGQERETFGALGSAQAEQNVDAACRAERENEPRCPTRINPRLAAQADLKNRASKRDWLADVTTLDPDGD